MYKSEKNEHGHEKKKQKLHHNNEDDDHSHDHHHENPLEDCMVEFGEPHSFAINLENLKLLLLGDNQNRPFMTSVVVYKKEILIISHEEDKAIIKSINMQKMKLNAERRK